MAGKTRKRQSLPNTSGPGNAPAPAGPASHAASWTAPTPDEFTSLRRYKSFLLPPNTSYFVGQYVWLAHEGSQLAMYPPQPAAKKARRSSYNSQSAAADGDDAGDTSDYSQDRSETDARWKAGLWLGKIIEIRARDTSYVWMKIRWMCRTVKELRDQNIRSGLPKGKVGGREIFQLGAEFDALQPVGAVEAHASVILYDEGNPMQNPISEHDIFYRSEAKTVSLEEIVKLGINDKFSKSKSGRKSEPSSEPIGHLFPYTNPTCYCGDGYLPLSDHPEPMAMCANDGCGKWFHLGCLDWKLTHRRNATDGYLEYVRTSGLHLLQLLPGREGERELSAAASVDLKSKALEAAKVHSNGNGKDAVTEALPSDDLPPIDAATLSQHSVLDAVLPEQIRFAAESPIARGDQSTGIVGNARKIVSAREIIALNRQVRSATSNAPGKAGRPSPRARKEIAVAKPEDSDQQDLNADSEALEGKLGRLVEQWQKLYGSDVKMEKRAVVWLCPSCRRAM